MKGISYAGFLKINAHDRWLLDHFQESLACGVEINKWSEAPSLLKGTHSYSIACMHVVFLTVFCIFVSKSVQYIRRIDLVKSPAGRTHTYVKLCI